MDEAVFYAFRIGSSDYPSGISRPYASRDDARAAAEHERNMGGKVGRVRKGTADEIHAASAKVASGVVPAGW